ncbi:MAG: hypothetical protein AAFY48_19660 [Bacteroidota bacterium]
MKLRILNNSLRLRLSQGEVRELADQQSVRATTHFPGGVTFSYAIRQTTETDQPQAAYFNQEITVLLPATMVDEWANGNDISLRASSPLPDGNELTILVEKDFKCLTDRPHEDESDLFPHPKQGDVTC